MKINGVEVNGPAEEVLVLPRANGDIVFRAKAVLDMKGFEALVPEPKAPQRLEAGGFKTVHDDVGYVAQVKKREEQRFAYMCIKSLEPSNIEWEKVDLDKPSTWLDWETELREAGFSAVEINRIAVCVMGANALDEDKLKRARDVFLRGQGTPQAKSSGQDTEPQNTPSGEPAKDSE